MCKDMKKKVCIIGSGPIGGIAAEYFSSNSNFYIDVIDVGITSSTHHSIIEKDFIPPKNFFGNSFMYMRVDNLKFFFDKFSKFYTSHAKGGLSNVWGGNISYIHIKYLKKWGLSNKVFSDSFSYVLSKIPVCAREDMIDELYDLKIKNHHVIKSGISYDHASININNKKLLYKNNLNVGLSKLALNTLECVKDASCMIGCKKSAIFNATDFLDSLLLNPKVSYKSGYFVTKFVEIDNKVNIYAKSLKNNRQQIFSCDYLIVAAGTIDSTILVRKSLNIIQKFKIKESKKFYVPFISTRFFSSSNLTDTISLSHIFIQNLEKQSLLHCQLYPSYFVLKYILEKKFGKFSTLLLLPFKFIFKYIYLAMIYLDSEDSGSIKFDKTSKGAIITGSELMASKFRLNIFLKRIRASYKSLKLLPINFILSSKLGHSQHFGATMPMKKKPNKQETDMFGRPYKFKRTYIVDTSVLPSIPSSPTTIIAMSNCVRICKSIINKNTQN